MVVTSKCQHCKRKVELLLSEVPTFRGVPSPASYANSFQDAVNATCSICFKEKHPQAYQNGVKSHWEQG